METAPIGISSSICECEAEGITLVQIAGFEGIIFRSDIVRGGILVSPFDRGADFYGQRIRGKSEVGDGDNCLGWQTFP